MLSIPSILSSPLNATRLFDYHSGAVHLSQNSTLVSPLVQAHIAHNSQDYKQMDFNYSKQSVARFGGNVQMGYYGQ